MMLLTDPRPMYGVTNQSSFPATNAAYRGSTAGWWNFFMSVASRIKALCRQQQAHHHHPYCMNLLLSAQRPCAGPVGLQAALSYPTLCLAPALCWSAQFRALPALSAQCGTCCCCKLQCCASAAEHCCVCWHLTISCAHQVPVAVQVQPLDGHNLIIGLAAPLPHLHVEMCKCSLAGFPLLLLCKTNDCKGCA